MLKIVCLANNKSAVPIEVKKNRIIIHIILSPSLVLWGDRVFLKIHIITFEITAYCLDTDYFMSKT